MLAMSTVVPNNSELATPKIVSQLVWPDGFDVSLSGLNLAFLGYLNSGQIKLNKYLLNWPDGIFKRRFYGSDIPKVSGLSIITNMQIPNTIENIYVLGSLSKSSKEFL